MCIFSLSSICHLSSFLLKIYYTIKKHCNYVYLLVSDAVPSQLVNATTLSSNKRIYPRGIINPNYPGFQHFAHTLSEHFIEHQNTNVQSGNMSDSDSSELECDVHKIESAKVPAENMVDFENDGIACDPNGNSIIDTTADIEREDNLNKVAEILRTVFESNSSHLLSAIDTFAEKESNDIDNVFDDNATMTGCIIQYDELDTMVDSPPPDILQKSSSSESGFESSAEKPDILLNVSDEPDCVQSTTLLTVEKEESNSVTPVDIVGNFEQEVQREIGLLVTRYKNHKKNNGGGGVNGDASFASEKMLNKVKILLNEH